MEKNTPSIEILLVTATPLETEVLHSQMDEQLEPVYVGANTYLIGRFGRYRVAHVQCGMGSIGPSGAQLTVAQAIEHFQPKLIVVPGIAFGVDANSQEVGDVLVSTQVIAYEPQRVGKEITVFRGEHAPADTLLIDRFTNQRQWKHVTYGSNQAKILPGPLLSGNLLLDNAVERDALLKQFPKAIGGEMEGVGVYGAAHRARTPWIVVKGICDYADGNKAQDKQARQRRAAEAAISLCRHVFSQKNVFLHAGCASVDADLPSNLPVPTYGIEQVLFDRYRVESEPFYQARSIDSEVQILLRDAGLWVWGASGAGKTCLAVRAAIQSNLRPILIDLAAAPGDKVEKILALASEKLRELASLPRHSNGQLKQLPQVIDAFSATLTQARLGGTLVILDEVPVASSAALTALGRALASVHASIRNIPLSDRPTLVVSLLAPLQSDSLAASKLREYVHVIQVPTWHIDELRALTEKLARALSLELRSDEVSRVAAEAGSPRGIKCILRTFVRTFGQPEWNLDRAIRTFTSGTWTI